MRQRRAYLLAVGVVFVATGVTLIALGETARRVVVLLLAGLVLVRSLQGFISAVNAYRDPEGDPFWPLARGVLTLSFGVAILLVPGTVITVGVFAIGVAWILGGVIVVVNALLQGEDDDVPQDIVAVIRSNSMAAPLRREVTEAIFEGWDTAEGTLRFSALMGFATAIATLGIKADSTAVVIGAMLVAPLMSPIMALSASILMGWPVRAARSGWRVGLGVLIGVGGSFLVSLVSPEFVTIGSNSEVLSRVSPTLLDLMIALAAGAAGGYVMTHPKVGNSLPGVAIAVALAPPLAVVGVSLESGAIGYAGGAFLLFLTNLVGIVVASGITYVLSGYSPWTHLERSGEQGRRSLVLVGIALALVVLPLAVIGDDIVTLASAQTDADKAVEDWLGEDTEFEIAQVRVFGGRVEVVIVGPGEAPDPQALAQSLALALERPVDLELSLIPETHFSETANPPPRREP